MHVGIEPSSPLTGAVGKYGCRRDGPSGVSVLSDMRTYFLACRSGDLSPGQVKSFVKLKTEERDVLQRLWGKGFKGTMEGNGERGEESARNDRFPIRPATTVYD